MKHSFGIALPHLRWISLGSGVFVVRKEGKMRLGKCWIAIAFIFMVVSFMRGNVSAYDMDEYYPLTQGDKWTYVFTLNGNSMPDLEVFVDGTEVVNGVETIKWNMSSPFPSEYDYYCYAWDSEGLKNYKTNWVTFGVYVIYNPPVMYFPANMKAEENYEGPYSYMEYSIDDDSIVEQSTGSETITLESVEDVTVPAGMFKDCLKISMSASYNTEYGEGGDDFGEEGFDMTIWLARWVGMVKENITSYQRNRPGVEDSEVTITHELSDYDVKKPYCAATVALGKHPSENDLNTLRKFRDNVLCKTQEGRELIKRYYQWSPAFVKAMEEDEDFKGDVKEMVDGVLMLIEEETE
jgi:hypothetical protein